MGISFWNLVLILMIVFVVFGAGKLPKVMGELGKGLKSLREGMNEANKITTSKNEKE